MSDMPEDIYAKRKTRIDGGLYWTRSTGKDGLTPYTRKDIHETLTAERDALKSENDRLQTLLWNFCFLEQGMDSCMRQEIYEESIDFLRELEAKEQALKGGAT